MLLEEDSVQMLRWTEHTLGKSEQFVAPVPTIKCGDPHNIQRRVQIMKLLIIQLFPDPILSSKILRTLFSNILNVCSSLDVRDQVSHPYMLSKL
jgi:hypothetical protein